MTALLFVLFDWLPLLAWLTALGFSIAVWAAIISLLMG